MLKAQFMQDNEQKINLSYNHLPLFLIVHIEFIYSDEKSEL